MLAESNKKVDCVIPARLNSSRFPRKILADICGKPMVIRTAEQVKKSNVGRVIIAVDDLEVLRHLSTFGFEVLMTSDKHQTGTDRISEIVSNIPGIEKVLNVQADEPLIDVFSLNLMIEEMQREETDILTLASTKISIADFSNKNVVKAILDEKRRAVDFKRIIDGNFSNLSIFKHLGVYGFNRSALMKFVSLERSKREKERSLEQLRAIDNGMNIKCVITNADNMSVDIEEDYKRAKERFLNESPDKEKY